MHDEHLSYSTINTSKSALCTYICTITREKYTHGELRTCQTFHERTLCVEPTSPQIHGDLGCKNSFRLTYLKKHTLNLTMLLCLVTAQRSQTLHLRKFNDVTARGQRKLVVKNFSQTFVKNAFYFL